MIATSAPSARSLLTSGQSFILFECTKGEVVAAGSNDNVLRWKSNEASEQQWCLERTNAANKYYIRSQKANNRYLNIQGFTGNASIYPHQKNSHEQMFEIDWLSDAEAQRSIPSNLYRPFEELTSLARKTQTRRGFEFVRIKESTRGERLAVGSNGNLLRWGAQNDHTQTFVMFLADKAYAGRGRMLQEAGKAMMSSTSRGWLSQKDGITTYTDPDILKGHSSSWQGKYYKKFSSKDLTFFIMSDATNLYVSFRGTEGNLHWAMNGRPTEGKYWWSFINALPVLHNRHFEGVWTHAGWGPAIAEIYPTILEEMQRQGLANKTVTITGYSLGGVLAGHLAYLLMKDKELPVGKPHRVVTFGAGQYASPSFRAHYEGHNRSYPQLETFCVEVTEDPIPGMWRDAVLGTGAGVGVLGGAATAILFATAVPGPLGHLVKRSLNDFPGPDWEWAHSPHNYQRLVNNL